MFNKFFRHARADNSGVGGGICPKFKLVQAFMHVDARVFTTLYINFTDTQGQITLELVAVSGQNLNSSKLSCMSSLPAKMRMIESKMKEQVFT